MNGIMGGMNGIYNVVVIRINTGAIEGGKNIDFCFKHFLFM